MSDPVFAIPRARARLGGLGAMLLLLCGCASLPTGFHKPESQAFEPARGGSALASMVETGHPAGESGFRLLPTGAYAFNTRVALARRAERSLDLQYYIIHDDETGRALLGELRAAAVRGIRVRLLIDDIATETMDQSLLLLSTMANVEVRVFNPFTGGRSSTGARILASLGDLKRINHRMHNKSFIADGAMAVTGGRNLGDEYFMHSSRSNFIDLDVFVAGPAVTELSSVFDRYWNSDYAYPIAALVRFDQAMADKAARMRAAPGSLGMVGADGLAASARKDVLGYPPLAQEMEAGKLALTWAPARVVADVPSKVAGVTDATIDDTASGMLLTLLGQAQQEVQVVSPYFVPGERGMKVMRNLHQRGVRMTVLTNSLAATDTPIVHTGYARYRLEMLQLGVQLYELSPTRGPAKGALDLFSSSRAKLHAKTAVIDRRRLFVGSINLDARSARTNTEQGVIIDSPALAAEVLQLLVGDKAESAFHLRLTPDRHHIEWVATTAGVESIVDDEPDASLLLKFGLWLLAPIALEELL